MSSEITSLDLTKPVQTVSGYSARIICTDRFSNIRLGSVIYLYKSPDGSEVICSCTPDGRDSTGDKSLINTPEIKRVYFAREIHANKQVVVLSKPSSNPTFWDNLGYVDIDLSTLKPVE